MAKTLTKTKQELVIPEDVVSSQKSTRLQRAAEAKLEEAKGIKVTNPKSYKSAADFCLMLKETEKGIEELYEEPTKKAHELHKALTGARKKLLGPLQEARELVQQKMGDWDLLERQKAEEKALEEAEEQRKLELEEAKEEGDRKLVKELQSAPVVVGPIAVPTPKVQGVVTKREWKFRVVDQKLVPKQFLMVDEKALGDYVKSYGGDAVIPGVEVYEEVKTFMRG